MMNKTFDFRWKLVENYSAAIVGAVFIWLLVEGLLHNDSLKLTIATAIIVIAPFLVTFLDRKSAAVKE